MGLRTIHSATVTVKLPDGMSTEDEVKALLAAGIPVDSQCNPKSGLLFVHLTKTREANFFRWFACDANSVLASLHPSNHKPRRRMTSWTSPDELPE